MISGWGSIDKIGGTSPNILQKLAVTVDKASHCHANGAIPGFHICARKDGSSACSGDSGRLFRLLIFHFRKPWRIALIWSFKIQPALYRRVHSCLQVVPWHASVTAPGTWRELHHTCGAAVPVGCLLFTQLLLTSVIGSKRPRDCRKSEIC